MKLEGTRVLVVGMARSGLAAVELLRDKGAVVRATDAKALDELPDAGPALKRLGVPFEVQASARFQDADLVVISPGVPADIEPLAEARARGVRVIGETELAGWFLEGPILGVTGANGKTTTTSLVGHILRECGIPAQVGGNIGAPPAGMVRASRPGQWNVLELSSFQLETIERFRANIAVAVNVTPDHLDRHHTFEAYAAAKGRLFENQREEDFAVLNADDATCAAYARLGAGTPVWFSLEKPVAPGCRLAGGRLYWNEEAFLEAKEIPLRGRHNIQNVLAAAAAARMAGAELAAIASAVRTFPGVEHRLEYVRTVSGIDFYNDSKATNVDAALKAVDAFEGGLWIILGGKDKGAPYTPLREPLRAKARAALLIGAAAEKIAACLEGAVPLVRCGTLEAAVAEAYRAAAPGDTILLAPACASFDQFDSYEHRGRVFKRLAASLEAKA